MKTKEQKTKAKPRTDKPFAKLAKIEKKKNNLKILEMKSETLIIIDNSEIQKIMRTYSLNLYFMKLECLNEMNEF